MSDDEKVLGRGSEFEFRGKWYRIASITYDMRAEFSSWLKRRAVMAIKEQRPYLSDEEYAAKMDRVDRNIAAGVYSFGGQLSLEASQSPDGAIEILRLSLKKNHPEITTDMIQEMIQEEPEAVQRALKRANDNPKMKPLSKKKR